MEIEEIKQYLEKVKVELATPNSYIAHHEAFTRKYYSLVTRKEYIRRNCDSYLRDLLIEMYMIVRKDGFALDDRKYKLKRGKLLCYKSINYTYLTLTDAVAKSYLKDYPDNKDRFFAEVPPTTGKQTIYVEHPTLGTIRKRV